jgi:hypothetical protein
VTQFEGRKYATYLASNSASSFRFASASFLSSSAERNFSKNMNGWNWLLGGWIADLALKSWAKEVASGKSRGGDPLKPGAGCRRLAIDDPWRLGRADSRRLGRADSRKLGRADSRKLGRVDSLMLGKSDSGKLGRADSRKLGRADSRRLGRASELCSSVKYPGQ